MKSILMIAALGSLSGYVIYMTFKLYRSFYHSMRETYQSWENMHSLLEKRYDEYTKLVRESAASKVFDRRHVEEMLVNRIHVNSLPDIDAKISFSNQLEINLTSLQGQLDAAPQFHSHPEVQEILSRINSLDTEIEAVREHYNYNATVFNKKCCEKPNSLWAKIHKCKQMPLFAPQRPSLSLSSAA